MNADHTPEILTVIEGMAKDVQKIAEYLADQAAVKKMQEIKDNLSLGPSAAELRARAEHNRDHAEELYGDKLILTESGDGKTANWRERDTLKTVVFTPYGWRAEDDD